MPHERYRPRAARLRRGGLVGFVGLTLLAPVACSYTSDLSLPRPDQGPTEIFAADGTRLATLHAAEYRDPVPLAAISPRLRDAVIAIEDSRFFEHDGVDPRAVVRALTRNTEEGDVVEGGSTITQQYVRTVLLDPVQTVNRKLQEAVLAVQLERRYSKEAILERYLNTIYFGDGAYGAQAAARHYFGVDATALDLAQAAVLAGIIQAPESYNPYRDQESALARRAVVLGRMAELGVADGEEVAAARVAPLGLVDQVPERYPAGHFVEQVKRFVLADPRFGETEVERRRLLYQGGLRIETTLVPRVQIQAELAIGSVLADADRDPSAALVALDPRTGHVLAYVGGRDFFGASPIAQFDLAGQGTRQAGSSFKPFVLAAALEQGIPLERRYPAPGRMTLTVPGYEPWDVANYDGAGGGRMTVEAATIESVNTVYAQLARDVGPHSVVETAARLGVRSPLDAVPSAALGTNAVTVLDMASGYATLAGDGLHATPTFVTRVTNGDGTLLYEAARARRRVIDANVAREVTATLEQVVERGTGSAARLDRPVAGKTGTAEEWSDAWFVGYTPDLVAAVWVGFPDATRSMRPPATDITVTGGSWPAEIWHTFVAAALAGTPASEFAEPEAPPQPPTTTVARLTVPSLVRMRVRDAHEQLVAAGFEVVVEARADSQFPPGVVLDQSPLAGRSVRPGATVRLVVASAAPVPRRVPNVLGALADEAAAILDGAELGIRVVVESATGGAVDAAGRVWRQAPDEGGLLDPGGLVTVWVSPA